MNFKEVSYTVAESDGQVSISLRINGQFFIPVWAIVEISDGTATGGLCISQCLYMYMTDLCACLHERLSEVYIYNHSLMESRGNFMRYSHGKVLLICFIITEEGPNVVEMSYRQSKEPYHVDYT